MAACSHAISTGGKDKANTNKKIDHLLGNVYHVHFKLGLIFFVFFREFSHENVSVHLAIKISASYSPTFKRQV